MIFSEVKRRISCSRHELALQTIEAKFNVGITIHDLCGKIGLAEPGSPLFGRHLHPQKCCRWGRQNIPGGNSRCVNNCFRETELHAARVRSPFLKECWMGLCELVVPVHYQKVHQLTIFAGVFKGSVPPASRLPEAVEAMYRELPEPEPEKLTGLGELLHTFGTGLLNELDNEEIRGDNRLARIRRYIADHAHEPITLDDVARELFISVSRTRHLITELAGRSFSELLEEIRMNRAGRLLLSSEQSLAGIAEAVGYSNVHYFSRRFVDYFGMPPGRYRRMNRNAPQT